MHHPFDAVGFATERNQDLSSGKLDFQFNGDRGYLLCFVTVIQIPRAKSVIEKISPLFLLNLRVGAKYAITSVHKIANHTIIKCIV